MKKYIIKLIESDIFDCEKRIFHSKERLNSNHNYCNVAIDELNKNIRINETKIKKAKRYIERINKLL